MLGAVLLFVLGQGCSLATDRSYVYTEISSTGVAEDHLEWADQDYAEFWREPGGVTRVNLPCHCPVSFSTELCSLSASYPFLVPTRLPKDGALTLEFGESGLKSQLKFKYDVLENFSMLKQFFERVVFVRASVESSAMSSNGPVNFMFIFHPQKGVLAYSRLQSHSSDVGEDRSFRAMAVLSSNTGIRGSCSEE
jgi:hypothetical protein